MRTRLLLLLLAGLAGAAAAYFPLPKEAVCPVCLADFSYMSEASGTVFDGGLDFRPLGMTVSPPALPSCPDCGFLVFASSAAAAELAAWRELALSPGYAALKDRSPWRRAAYLRERLFPGRRELLGHTFLKAAWEEEGDKAREREDLELALAHFDAHLASLAAGTPGGAAAYLKAELLRRLSRFKEALRQLDSLDAATAADPDLARLIGLQRELCRRGDPAQRGVKELEERPSEGGQPRKGASR